MVSFFEDVPAILPKGKAYAHFIIPDEIIIFDNMKHSMTCIAISYINNKTQSEEAYNRGKERLEKIVEKIINNPTKPETYSLSSKGIKNSISLISEMDPDVYKNGVNKIKEHIIA